MKDEDRKVLTEFLGECFHDIENKGPYQSTCSKCGMTFGAIHSSDWNPNRFNRTFDTWEDFGALWEKIDKKDLAISWIIQGEYERFILQSWRMWERAIPEKRCLVILEAIKEGVLK